MIAIRDIAWAAGFLEGEGHFHKTESGVGVSQVEREPLEKLRGLFGGNIKDRVGKPGHKDFHVWSIHGSNAAAAMMTVWSFMSAKRRAQIERSLSVWKSQRERSRLRGPTGRYVSLDSSRCHRGHDLRLVGRGRKGCKQCARDYGREWMRQRRASRRTENGA